MAEIEALFGSKGRDISMVSSYFARINRDPAKTNVGFISIANPDQNPFQGSLATVQTLRNIGVENIKPVTISGVPSEKLHKQLDGSDLIVVNGQDTQDLRAKILVSDLPEVVHDLIKAGVVFLGLDAGAELAGPDLGVIPFHIDPNFEYSSKKVRDLLQRDPMPGVALEPRQALYLSGLNSRIMGGGYPHTYNNFSYPIAPTPVNLG